MITDKDGIAEPLAITIQDTGECISHVVCSFCKLVVLPFEKGKCPHCADYDNLYPSLPCENCGDSTLRYRKLCESCYLEGKIKEGTVTIHNGPYDCMLHTESDEYFCDEWEVMDHLYDKFLDECISKLPKYAYLTEPTLFELDAYSIVEHACEELFEGAFDHISREEIKELQSTLDNWVDKVGMSPTYYPDYTKVIELPWDEFFNSNPTFRRP